MIIKNAKVFTDGCRFVEKDLVIRDGRIVFGAAPQENEEVLDAKGSYALPGLVDIHFHGAVGHDFCDADEAGLQAIWSASTWKAPTSAPKRWAPRTPST